MGKHALLGWLCVVALAVLAAIRIAADVVDGSSIGEALWFVHAMITLVLGYTIGRRVGASGCLDA
jgi:predicted Na+-dependent transporter